MYMNLLALFLFILSFNVLGQKSCTTKLTIQLTFKDSLVVEYHSDKKLYALNFDSPLAITSSYNGYQGSMIEKSQLNGIALIHPKKSKKLQLSMRTLNKFANAAYSPYLKVNQAHGIHVKALIPSHILLNKKGKWKEIDRNCIYINKVDEVEFSSPISNGNLELGFVLLSNNQTPIPTERTAQANYFIDDSLPKWIKSLVLKNTEVFINFYQAKLSIPSPPKVTIVVAFEQAKQPFFDGGVHKNTIVIRFGGDIYKKPDPLASNQITEFLAHELFHLWSDDSKKKTSWIHEGAAEYAAILAAKELNLILEEEFNSRLAQRSYKCLMSYGGNPIPDKTSWLGRYDCGVALLNGLLEGNLFSYWKKQLESNKRSDLDFLKQFVSSEQSKLLTLVTSPNTPNQLVSNAYAQIVTPFYITKAFSNYLIVQQVFINLMKKNCQGLVSFSVFGDSVEIYPQANCQKPFNKINGLTKNLNGINLSKNPSSILRSYLEFCNKEKKVKISGDSFNIELVCYIDDEFIKTIKINK